MRTRGSRGDMDSPNARNLGVMASQPANDLDVGMVTPISTPASVPGPFGRSNPDPGVEFHRTYTPDVKAMIVRAVKKAYEIVGQSHDEALGFNANTFGICVYHVGRFQLEAVCKQSEGKLSNVEELKSLFRFQSGAYTLGFYKVGQSDENIWESFPTSDNGAMSLSDEGYPILVGLEDSMLDRVNDLRYVVVAHMGNPISGLCAIYLCVPIRTKNGKIQRWGYAEAIYLRDRNKGSMIPPPSVPPPENPPLDIALQEEPEGEVIVTAK